MVMLELRLLDARKQSVKPEYLKLPYIEIENLVFIRVPEDKMKAMTATGEIDGFRDRLMEAAASTNKTWVSTGEVLALLDAVQENINNASKEGKVPMTDVAQTLFAMRDELKKNNNPTNKTFVIVPETVRFMEVREKWETVHDKPPTKEARDA
jgi:hypothetical protein